jgi:hypothetical protein
VTDDDRLDFSALDPKRDPARFERMVAAVVEGVGTSQGAVHPLWLALFGWGRVAVATAAAVALCAWIPTLAGGRAAEPASSDRVALVSSWANSGRIPSDADLYRVLEATP